ncbi:MAG: hypothetical protein JSV79_03850 [Armatimonadota bacterium]|nr:MAG: hypothetical protein JSV79_03850 [Armatimonadota bacterium]
MVVSPEELQVRLNLNRWPCQGSGQMYPEPEFLKHVGECGDCKNQGRFYRILMTADDPLERSRLLNNMAEELLAQQKTVVPFDKETAAEEPKPAKKGRGGKKSNAKAKGK